MAGANGFNLDSNGEPKLTEHNGVRVFMTADGGFILSDISQIGEMDMDGLASDMNHMAERDRNGEIQEFFAKRLEEAGYAVHRMGNEEIESRAEGSEKFSIQERR